MSEQSTRRALHEASRTPREALDLTIAHALLLCAQTIEDSSRIEADICQHFKVTSLDALSPETMLEAQRWVLSVWTTRELETTLRNVFDRLNSARADVQLLFLQLTRQRTLLAKHFQRLVVALLLVALALPSAHAAPLLQPPVVFPPVNVDPQTVLNAIAAAPKVSAFVDAAFVFDCVKGFPAAYWPDAYLGPGAAGVATEIAPTAYSPRLLVLQSGNLLMTYFGDWTGPKLMQRLTGFLDRVPPRDAGEAALKIVWQNVYPALGVQQTRRGNPRTDPRDQDECQKCMQAVVYRAHRAKVLKQEGAKVVLIGATAVCIAGSAGLALGICLAVAAATFAVFYRLAEEEFQDRILSAKNDECAVDRRTGKSCEWER